MLQLQYPHRNSVTDGPVEAYVCRAATRRQSVRVRFTREQAAVDAISLGRRLDPHVLNPVGAPMFGSRVLPAVFREIVTHYVCRESLFENLGRACRLDRTARKHGNSRRASIDAVGEHFGVVPLVLAF